MQSRTLAAILTVAPYAAVSAARKPADTITADMLPA